MLVYIISSGRIIAKIPKGQPYDYLYEDEKLGTYENDDNIDLERYLIIEGELIELNNLEVLEIQEYNRILLDTERVEKELLDKLKPSISEVRKAEQTIEILTLISEVI